MPPGKGTGGRKVGAREERGRAAGRVLPRTLAVIALAAAPAMAGDPVLEALLPGFSIAFEDSASGEGGTRLYGSVLASREDIRVFAPEVTLAREAGTIRIVMPRVVAGREGEPATMAASDVSLTLSGPPDLRSWGDPVCAVVETVESLEIGRLELTAPGGGRPDGKPLLALDSLRLAQARTRELCASGASVTAASMRITLPGGGRMDLAGVGAEVEVPMALPAAAAFPGRASLSLSAARVEDTSMAGVQRMGLSGLHIHLEAEGARLQPLVHLLRGLVVGRSAGSPGRDASQVWNALHVSRMAGSVRADGVRLWMPGIVPSELAVNFTRAGLTTLLGSFEGSLSLGEMAELAAAAYLSGVAETRLQISGSTLPIPAETAARLSGLRDFLLGGIDLLEVARGAMTYRDGGMNDVSVSVFGVPAGRVAEGLADALTELGPDAHRDLQMDALESLARLFRTSERGNAVLVRLSAGGLPLRLPAEILERRDLFTGLEISEGR